MFIRCRDDGKKLILQVIRDIYLAKQLESIPSTPITAELFDNHLNKIIYSNLWTNLKKSVLSMVRPDPDLLMILGNNKSIMGFFPWNIRNTEIQ